MAQLNPWETIICISHQTNTFDKKKLRASGQTNSMKPARPTETQKALTALAASGYINTTPKRPTHQIHSTNHGRITLISGPWGSGTTAICKALSKLGLEIPGPYFKTNDPRTPNSFETLSFNQLIHHCVNEQELERKAPSKEIVARLRHFSETMKGKGEGESNMTALKAPASSAILDELAEVFKLRLIICLRDYSEIESTRVRRGWPAYFGREGAKKIYSQINEFIANTSTPYHFVRYSDLTNQSTVESTFDEISRFLNIQPSSESINSAIASIKTNHSVDKQPRT